MHTNQNFISSPIPLHEDEIHLWLIDEQAVEDAKVLTDCHAILSKEESQHLTEIKSSKRKQQFLITRAALRLILLFYVNRRSPIDIRFTKNRFGKPALEDKSSDLKFNISHTNGKVLIGVTEQRELGVDIEYMKKNRDIYKIAEHYFHSNEWPFSLRETNSYSKHLLVKHFYKLWTLKEAFIKAEGRGLFLATDLFYFEDCGSHKPKLVVPSSDIGLTKKWQFEHRFLHSNHSLSVAFEDTISKSAVKVVARQYVPLRDFSPIDLG